VQMPPGETLNTGVDAEQLLVAGNSCSFALRQACFGACRNGGADPATFLPTNHPGLHLAYTTNNSTLEAPFAGLELLLRRVLTTARGRESACSLTLAGDSVTHDTYVAALAGCLHLRLKLERCAWRGVPSCRGSSASCSLRQHTTPAALCGGSSSTTLSEAGASDLAVFSVPPSWRPTRRRQSLDQRLEQQGRASVPPTVSCRRLTLRYTNLRELVVNRSRSTSILDGGGVLMMNAGLWANRPSELTGLLESDVRPLLDRLAASPLQSRARLLWRETSPQHFASRSGTGLFAERSGSAAASQTIRCAPVGSVVAAVDPKSGADAKRVQKETATTRAEARIETRAEGVAADGAAATVEAEVAAQRMRVSKAGWRNRHFERWSRPWRMQVHVLHRTHHHHEHRHKPQGDTVTWSGGSVGGRRLGLRTSGHHGGAMGRSGPRAGPTNTTGSHSGGTMNLSSWGTALRADEPTTLLRIVPAFRALLPRHDLHAAPDCTHFCYSPWLWAPIWRAAAEALAAP